MLGCRCVTLESLWRTLTDTDTAAPLSWGLWCQLSWALTLLRSLILPPISGCSELKHLLLPKTRFCLFLNTEYDSVMKNEIIIHLGGLQERGVGLYLQV